MLVVVAVLQNTPQHWAFVARNIVVDIKRSIQVLLDNWTLIVTLEWRVIIKCRSSINLCDLPLESYECFVSYVDIIYYISRYPNWFAVICYILVRMYVFVYIYIQGVPRVKVTTSGECSLC